MAKYSDYQWILAKVTDSYLQESKVRSGTYYLKVIFESPQGSTYFKIIGLLKHQYKVMRYLGIDPDRIEETQFNPMGKVFQIKLIPQEFDGRSFQIAQTEVG